MKVVLLGYMGCGKSVIGDFLAKKLQVSFYDLDEEIENVTQISISELFQTKGEIYFRKKENEVLKTFLDCYDLVAQLVEHITFNDGVLGSSPSQVTKI